MAMYDITRQEYGPFNFIAGDLNIVREGYEVGAGGVKRFAPVKLDENGKVVAINAPTEASGDDPATNDPADVIGIAVAAADEGENTVVYETGEFYGDALALETGVTVQMLRPYLRKCNIYLREGR